MKSFLTFFFWVFLPKPKAGDKFTGHAGIVYTVVEPGFVEALVTYNFPDINDKQSEPELKCCRNLMAFYTKI